MATESKNKHNNKELPNEKPQKLKKFHYFTDSKATPLIINLNKRKWIRSRFNGPWDFYWGSNIFTSDSRYRLQRGQIVNQFPNSFELSRKDLLHRNVKKYCKALESQGSKLGTKISDGDRFKYLYMDFLPSTYILPVDYSIFLEEYRKPPHSIWIMKPCSRSLGSGISLVNSLTKIKHVMNSVRKKVFETYLISRYIENPFVIGGKKFDLRLYVLVTSFKPLSAFLYKNGFCRFSTEKYSKSGKLIEDKFIHLTNVSIQKNSSNYNSKHGGKWGLQNLKLYLEGTQSEGVADKLFHKISFLILHSLKAVSPMISNSPNCFQLFGYDVIIDDRLKPWLIEANAYPSLKDTTENDRQLKTQLIDDTISIVLAEKRRNGMEKVTDSIAASSMNFEKLIENDINAKIADNL